jgi:hypothetical protein
METGTFHSACCSVRQWLFSSSADTTEGDGMSDEPKKSWIIWILLPLCAMSIGGVLILAAYEFRKDTPLSELADRIFFFPGLGGVNGAIFVAYLFSAGLLLIVFGLFALRRYYPITPVPNPKNRDSNTDTT